MLNKIKTLFSGQKKRFQAENVAKKESYEDVFYRNKKNVLQAVKSFGVQEVLSTQSNVSRYVDYVYWGSDNLFPQKLLLASANNNIISGVTEAYKEMLIGSGYRLATKKASNFLQNININALLEKIAWDLVIFEGFSCEIFSQMQNIRFAPVAVKHVPFSRIRMHKLNIDGNRYRYYSAIDWSAIDYNGNLKYFADKSGYRDMFDVKEHLPYNNNKNEPNGYPQALYVDYEYHPSNDYYPKPDLQSIVGFDEINSQAQEFHVNYFKNGIMGSIIVNIPYDRGTLTDKEVQLLKNQLIDEAKTAWIGSQRAGQPFFNLYEVDGDGNILTPKAEIAGFPGDQNDRKYIEMFRTIDEQILLGLGVVAPSAFGLTDNSNALEKADVMVMAYDLTEKFRLKSKRKMIENFVNMLINRAGIDDEFTLPFENIAKPAIEVVQKVEKQDNQGKGASDELL